MKDEFFLILPSKKPETIGDILAWHIQLFKGCLKCELEKRIVEDLIERTNSLIRETIPLLKEDDYGAAAKLKLRALNKILTDYRHELSVIKGTIDSFHKTNETIIGGILQSYLGKYETMNLYEKHKNHHPDLLHGDGWMTEYLMAKEQWDKGKAAFITFGTFMDPAKVDLIVLSNSLDDKIKFKIDYDKIKSPLREEHE